MVWAERRKLAYTSGVLVFLGLVAVLMVRSATSEVATCFDHKKNGDETNVDCGGGCLQYCPNELAEPKVRWVRSFEVSPGVVHAIAYIEHSYPGASAKAAQYQFKLYDANNVLITTRDGTTYIGPMGRTALVETLIQTGNIPVATTRFSFVPPVPWEKSDPAFSQVVIKTDRTLLEKFSGGTRLTATLENKSRYAFSTIDVVAILYDANDNAITTSKALLPSLPALGTQTVYFTWPQSIDPKAVRTIEIIPRFNPFTATAL